MEQKLSDMLTEAKAGGPPPRYSADDVVEAGRRLKRRRRVQVWAGAAAALVVVAVGVTVPRFGGPEPMPAAPVLNTISYPAGEFAGNLIGFSAEGWTVSGTTMVTPAYEVAVISRPDDVGRVVVFRPGAFDATEARGAWEAVPVNDRPGFYRDGTLAWEYAQDAWAVVTIEGRAQPSREQVAAVAAGVQTGAEQPMRVGVKFGYVPAGYRLASAGEAPSQDGQSGLLLLKSETPFSYRYKAGDPIEAFPMGDRSLPKIQVAVQPALPGQTPGDPVCEATTCHVLTDDGRYAAVVSGELPSSEKLRMLREVTFADITDRATWFEAQDAVS